MYKAVITVYYKKGILDPQGNAVQKALLALGYQHIEEVRVGKQIEVKLEGESTEQVRMQVAEMCAKLLANPVIEDYKIDVAEVK